MNVTVLNAEEIKDKGDYKIWKVVCKDSDGVEIEADRASKWAPKPGDQGTIESTQYGPKFVPAGGGANNKGRQRDPAAEANSIEAQVAFKGAIEWATVQTAHGNGAPPKSADIVKLTAVFAKAIREAKS